MTAFLICCLSVLLTVDTCSQDKAFPVLTGAYLGQKTPGRTPKLFAPGIVSTINGAGCYGFMQGGKLFIFEHSPVGSDWKYSPVQVMEEIEGRWMEPKPETLGGLYPYNFTVSPDGRTLYFSSLRLPDGSGPFRHANIWKIDRLPDGWSLAVMLDPPVNGGGPDAYPTVTSDGTLYFMSIRPGGLGKDDIYVAHNQEGKYLSVENVGPPVNSEHAEVDLFVAPDESLIVFCSDRPGGFGKFDLYVSFRESAGCWSEPVNLGKLINTAGQEFRPSISADGKFFFFTRYAEGSSKNGLYWVDANVIYDLSHRDVRR